MVELVESVRRVSKGTTIGVGTIWITMFVIGLIMIIVPLKKSEEKNEVLREDAKKIIVPGAVIFALSLLFATGAIIAFFVSGGITILTSLYFKRN